MREGQADRPQLLFARAVARNCSFRFGNSFMRFSASSREIVARRGRSTLTCSEVFDFFMNPFCIQVFVCQPTFALLDPNALGELPLEKLWPQIILTVFACSLL